MRGKAALIDTLSFEFYTEGQPWVAYRQFCQHFLAPLALMSKKDIRLGRLLQLYIDGIPLDLASQILPSSTRLNPGLVMHLSMHSKAQKKYSDQAAEYSQKKKGMTQTAISGIIESLKNTIQKLEWEPSGTEWGSYYDITNYSDNAIEHKKQLVSSWVSEVKPKQVWDLGANNGVFSRLASAQGIDTVAFDVDPAAVEQNQRQVRDNKETQILPLLMDLTNPSSAIGWNNRERESFIERGPVDMVFSLALIHHLAISNNVPLEMLAGFFSEVGDWLIIEFVPKSDSQVKKLLQNRLDIFEGYTEGEFERMFEMRFIIHRKERIAESERTLYLMEKL
jgi:hypothetical protein